MWARQQKPKLYVEMVASIVSCAAVDGRRLDVAAEASFISFQTGVSESVAAMELIESCAAAGVNIKAPGIDAFDSLSNLHRGEHGRGSSYHQHPTHSYLAPFG